MKFQLRPYQRDTLDKLRDCLKNGSKRPILCLPTGAGKTVTFSHIAEATIAKGGKVIVVCHRRELIEQARKTMRAYGVPINGVSFHMVQTLARNMHKIPIGTNVAICDECHIGNFRAFADKLPESITLIGATATPLSASKKNPLNKTFDDVVNPVTIAGLVDDGYLAGPLHIQAKIDESKLEIGKDGEFTSASLDDTYMGLFVNIDEAYRQRRGKTIIFCSSIIVTDAVAERLCVPSVHSKMSDVERDAIVNAFKNTPCGTIVNCGILTAGFDDPEIETVIVFRATTSLPLWLQMCGRGSRVIPGKKSEFLIIDMGNNIKRHGLWHLDRDWKYIFENEGKKKLLKAAPYKNCINKDCECLIHASARVCEFCGTEQPTNEVKKEAAKTFVEIAYEKQEIPNYLRKPWADMDAWELLQRAEIGNVKNRKKYSMGWVLAQIKQKPKQQAIEMLKEVCILKGYEKGWVYFQQKKLGI